MAENKSKIDRLHDQIPKYFDTKNNPNWSAIIAAIGEQDEDLATLIEEVKKQLFIKTASRPYLDRLAANVSVQRPRTIGMDDQTFREYIPIVAYKPKQVKLIMDQLLDVFFFKELTTAFLLSSEFETFTLEDGWQLQYTVDGEFSERVEFRATDFIDISNATANEVVSAINRQVKLSFAVVVEDSIQKKSFIRLFTNTIGSKGSIKIDGGRANIGLKFNGYIFDAGNAIDTKWSVTKVGDLMTYLYVSGGDPGLNALSVGDIALINIPGNIGSFEIEELDVGTGSFSFRNIFGTVGNFTQTSDTDMKFLTDFTSYVYKQERKAVVWEVNNGEIIIETPTAPAVLRRQLKGSSHLNGVLGVLSAKVNDSVIQLENADAFPDSGSFLIEHVDAITTHIKTGTIDTTIEKRTQGRLTGFQQRYTYTSKAGNVLSGISPSFPAISGLYEANIISASRDANKLVTAVTATAHNFNNGEWVSVKDTIPTVNANPIIDLTVSIDGTKEIINIVDDFTFQYYSMGDQGQSTGGIASIERIGLASDQVKIFGYSSELDTGILGSYIWSSQTPYVLSSLAAEITEEIKAGTIVRTIGITDNEIPNEEGSIIFDYGTEFEEGPVRYLFKPIDNALALDPAYVFQYNHDIGAASTLIRRKGAHVLSGVAAEYPPYITDPAAAREVMQEIMRSVKSVGIFMNFLVRFPTQYYATLDVYKTGIDPG